MSVMKIAMIFDGLGWGGTERVGIDYVRIMKELGCDVDVYNLIPSLNAYSAQNKHLDRFRLNTLTALN